MQKDATLERNHLQERALSWLTETIQRNQLPYQIVGGLAAIAHGGKRPLHDIDLYLPFDEAALAFFQEIEPYVTWGPEAVIEGQWDLTYLKLNYQGQKVEIGDSRNVKIKDANSGAWVEKRIDFGTSVSRDILGNRVSVMPVAQLIAYKSILAREVDLQDIAELKALYVR